VPWKKRRVLGWDGTSRQPGQPRALPRCSPGVGALRLPARCRNGLRQYKARKRQYAAPSPDRAWREPSWSDVSARAPPLPVA